MIHIVPLWPSYSQTFVRDDIEISQTIFNQVQVFPLPLRQSSYGAKFRDFLEMLSSIPLVVSLYLKFDFRKEIKILLHNSHGFRPQFLLFYKMISAGVFLRRFKIHDQSEKIVIHAHFLSTGLEIALLLKSVFPEFFVIATAHGSDAFFQSTLKVSNLTSKPNLIFAASRAVERRIASCNAIESTCTSTAVIVRYCRVPKVVEVKTEMDGRFNSSELRILTVARFHPQKGLEIAIRAAKILTERNVLFHWSVIGDGDLRIELESLISDLDLGRQVTLLGVKSREYVQNIMKESDLLVLPSVRANNSSDGLPVVILEAMASGLYVISSDIGGILEAIDENRGSVVKPDAYVLSNEIQAVSERGEENLKYTSAAREWVELNCSRNALDPLLDAYQTLKNGDI